MLVALIIFLSVITLVVLADYRLSKTRSAPFWVNALGLLVVAGPAYLLFGDPGYGARMIQPTVITPGELAVRSFEDLEAAKSQDSVAWQDAAVMLRLQGDYVTAARAFDRAGDHAETPKEQARFYETAGLMQIEASDGIIDRDAYRMFTKALSSNPATIDAQFYLGVSNEIVGQRDIALIHFRTFLTSADPRHPLVADVNRRIDALTAARFGGEAAGAKAARAMPVLSQDMIDEYEALPEDEKADFMKSMTLRRLNQLKQGGGTKAEWENLARMLRIAGDTENADYASQRAAQ